MRFLNGTLGGHAIAALSLFIIACSPASARAITSEGSAGGAEVLELAESNSTGIEVDAQLVDLEELRRKVARILQKMQTLVRNQNSQSFGSEAIRVYLQYKALKAELVRAAMEAAAQQNFGAVDALMGLIDELEQGFDDFLDDLRSLPALRSLLSQLQDLLSVYENQLEALEEALAACRGMACEDTVQVAIDHTNEIIEEINEDITSVSEEISQQETREEVGDILDGAVGIGRSVIGIP